MRAISVLYILMLILSGCNIRENTLLPPDLVDGEYITGSVINHYANYLVQSRNDNSFYIYHIVRYQILFSTWETKSCLVR
jgi:hypothetical protein